MRLLLNLFQLLQSLPWWGVLGILAGLGVLFYGLSLYVRFKFDSIVRETVLSLGASLTGASATIHSVTPAAVPTGPSPYDPKEDDEEFTEGLDGESWNEEKTNFFTIDATITPGDPLAAWDPTILALIPADFAPADRTENSTRFGAMHSAEIFSDGSFQPAAGGDVQGEQRLRMLFAVDDDMRAMKFAYGVQYFGRIDLPAPVAAGR